jgi:hypothetical protein
MRPTRPALCRAEYRAERRSYPTEWTAMNYPLLIYEPPWLRAAYRSPEERPIGQLGRPRQALSMLAFSSAGRFLRRRKTTVKLRNRQRLVQDGPYADTKVRLGGFFIIDVPELGTALELAADSRMKRQVPTAALLGSARTRPCGSSCRLKGDNRAGSVFIQPSAPTCRRVARIAARSENVGSGAIATAGGLSNQRKPALDSDP